MGRDLPPARPFRFWERSRRYSALWREGWTCCGLRDPPERGSKLPLRMRVDGRPRRRPESGRWCSSVARHPHARPRWEGEALSPGDPELCRTRSWPCRGLVLTRRPPESEPDRSLLGAASRPPGGLHPSGRRADGEALTSSSTGAWPMAWLSRLEAERPWDCPRQHFYIAAVGMGRPRIAPLSRRARPLPGAKNRPFPSPTCSPLKCSVHPPMGARARRLELRKPDGGEKSESRRSWPRSAFGVAPIAIRSSVQAFRTVSRHSPTAGIPAAEISAGGSQMAERVGGQIRRNSPARAIIVIPKPLIFPRFFPALNPIERPAKKHLLLS